MAPDTFCSISKSIVGRSRGWQGRIAAKLGISQSRVSRYASGNLPVADVVAVALEGLLSREHPSQSIHPGEHK